MSCAGCAMHNGLRGPERPRTGPGNEQGLFFILEFSQIILTKPEYT